MALRAFVGGGLVGGLAYGYMKYSIVTRKREIKASIYDVQLEIPGATHIPDHYRRKHDPHAMAQYEKEHPFYTQMRKSWNECVFNARDKILDLLRDPSNPSKDQNN